MLNKMQRHYKINFNGEKKKGDFPATQSRNENLKLKLGLGLVRAGSAMSE